MDNASTTREGNEFGIRGWINGRGIEGHRKYGNSEKSTVVLHCKYLDVWYVEAVERSIGIEARKGRIGRVELVVKQTAHVIIYLSEITCNMDVFVEKDFREESSIKDYGIIRPEY